MKTVGETLKSVREKQKRSLSSIADSTHIKLEFLTALENGDFSLLPSPIAAQGFITNYAQSLGIEPKTALALLRRDFAVSRSTILPKHLLEPKSKRTAKKKNRFFLATLFVVSLLVLFFYGVLAFWHLRIPP